MCVSFLKETSVFLGSAPRSLYYTFYIFQSTKQLEQTLAIVKVLHVQ